MLLTSDEIIIDGTGEKVKGIKAEDGVYNGISFIYRRRDGRLYGQLAE